MAKIINSWFGFKNVRGHTFYSGKLGSTSIVVDLGANQGAFSRSVASRYGCRAYAVEASPELFAKIETAPLVQKFNYAMAGSDGVATFYESIHIEAGNILGPKSNSTGRKIEVQARCLGTLISELGLKEIDLLKVDIEGAEIQMFDGLRDDDLLKIRQMTVEFHDSVRIPNVTTEDVQRVCRRIIAMGFEGLAMGDRNTDWLFLNPRKVHLSTLAETYLALRKQLAAGVMTTC